MKSALQSMTVQSIKDTFTELGFAGLPSKPNKDALIRTFLHYWDEIKSNVAELGGRIENAPAVIALAQPASSGDALVAPFSGTPQRLGDDKPSSGYFCGIEFKWNS